MKEKLRLLLKGIILFLILIIPFSIMNVKADSGWDSSYDSGGSSGGSYSSGGSSWSSSDYDYGGSSYGGSSSGEIDIFGLIWLFIVIIIILYIASSKKTTQSNTPDLNVVSKENIYADISEERVKEFMPDMDLAKLRVMAYNKFVEIQNAWMEFDYDKLRNLCTDELYNSYVSQLEILKMKNGKNVMSNYTANSTKIIDIEEQNGNVTVTVFMNISFYDYVIDTKSNAVTRGTDARMINNNYEMKFVRSKTVENKVHKCPNCGAEITDKASSECKYCHSVIIKDSGDFVLSKKTNVN